jgi:hypothetical protein
LAVEGVVLCVSPKFVNNSLSVLWLFFVPFPSLNLFSRKTTLCGCVCYGWLSEFGVLVKVLLKNSCLGDCLLFCHGLVGVGCCLFLYGFKYWDITFLVQVEFINKSLYLSQTPKHIGCVINNRNVLLVGARVVRVDEARNNHLNIRHRSRLRFSVNHAAIHFHFSYNYL